MVSDLVTWLRAQLDEDERRAPLVADIMRLRPATARFADRLLAEVDAKRAVLDIWERENAQRYVHAEGESRSWLVDEVVKLLALPYADRPGYEEAWRP